MNKPILLAVALPVLALCLMIARAELNVNQGKEWQLQITGYDPRDLLRGHYLQFQVDYNFSESAVGCAGGSDCCICLTDTGVRTPLASKMECVAAKAECDSIIRAEFERELNRFYIPEDQAGIAEDLLIEAQASQDAYLKVSVGDSGKPVIKDLMIGDATLSSLLKND